MEDEVEVKYFEHITTTSNGGYFHWKSSFTTTVSYYTPEMSLNPTGKREPLLLINIICIVAIAAFVVFKILKRR